MHYIKIIYYVCSVVLLIVPEGIEIRLKKLQ